MSSDASSDLPESLRAEITRLCRSADQLDFFELLGVSRDADGKQIKRAYFALSKRYHPDRYFGKQLGAYEQLLAQAFDHIKTAYTFLKDDEQRDKYRSTLVNQARQRRASGSVSTVPSGAPGRAGNSSSGGAVRGRADRRSTPRSTVPGVRGSNLRRANLKAHLSTSMQLPRSRVSEFQAAPREDTEQSLSRRKDNRAWRRGRAIQKLKSAGTTTKDPAEQHYHKAKRAFDQGDPAGAVESIVLALRIEPLNRKYLELSESANTALRLAAAKTAYDRGKMELNANRPRAAIEHLQRAAMDDPTFEHLSSAAQCFFKLQRFRDAATLASKAVEINNSSAGLHWLLAQIYLKEELLKLAKRETSLVLTLEPDHREAKDLTRRMRGRW